MIYQVAHFICCWTCIFHWYSFIQSIFIYFYCACSCVFWCISV